VELYSIDDECRLFLSARIDDWSALAVRDIHAVIDLEAALDDGVPQRPGAILYVYFPIPDGDLPDLVALHATAQLGADLYRAGRATLVHCGMGLNRSALLAGMILSKLGWSGAAAAARVREKRPGALFNPVFNDYLVSLPGSGKAR
jgi:protein-tyrosine phosphatase